MAKVLIHPSVTSERILEMAQADDNLGLCIYCGEAAYGVEPDARRHECEWCEKPGVYGAEELLITVLG